MEDKLVTRRVAGIPIPSNPWGLFVLKILRFARDTFLDTDGERVSKKVIHLKLWLIAQRATEDKLVTRRVAGIPIPSNPWELFVLKILRFARDTFLDPDGERVSKVGTTHGTTAW